ncbi:Mitochondrial fission protein ELM1 [Hibiscus syriacus]|uniref:Mitochondrial fission protein ELM1 n=1 Tax=Hibiscus syriacus TaxID=106335 RepID=A0A6A3CIK3_HIBSY|nr:Mitochondrial fission protein ELM1 [Hibiscus syriacus]
MRPIGLPELPVARRSTAEVFEARVYGVIKRVAVIGNGFSGAKNQCIGLVRALGLLGHHTLYRVTRPRGGINKWLHWLPVSLHKKVDYVLRQICIYSGVQTDARRRKVVPFSVEKTCLSSVIEADAKQIATTARDTFEMEGPLLVIASGRDTISIASSIKRLATDNVFVVQIQHPRSRLNRFDLVITPQHDYYPSTPHAQRQIPWFLRSHCGALHLADSAALRSAASVWHDELAPLAKPLLVVNIGGPTSNCQYGADLAKQLTAILQNVLWSCGSVRISFSRTPEKVPKILLEEFSSNPKVYIWDGEGPNPHMGHLAWADAFVITADSELRDVHDSSPTSKSLYGNEERFALSPAKRIIIPIYSNTLQRIFTMSLWFATQIEACRLHIYKSWSYSPLDDIVEAASQMKKLLVARGWTIHS